MSASTLTPNFLQTVSTQFYSLSQFRIPNTLNFSNFIQLQIKILNFVKISFNSNPKCSTFWPFCASNCRNFWRLSLLFIFFNSLTFAETKGFFLRIPSFSIARCTWVGQWIDGATEDVEPWAEIGLRRRPENGNRTPSAIREQEEEQLRFLHRRETSAPPENRQPSQCGHRRTTPSAKPSRPPSTSDLSDPPDHCRRPEIGLRRRPESGDRTSPATREQEDLPRITGFRVGWSLKNRGEEREIEEYEIFFFFWVSAKGKVSKWGS